jgi:TPR repeat protein
MMAGLLKSADRGDATSQYFYGAFFEAGNGVKKDLAEAAK